MQELIGRRVGPYEIRSIIGRGGMATVYRAYQASLNRDVAIKLLPPFMAQDEHFVARFRQEALAAGALSHPNILRIYDADTYQGQHYIVMDYVTGGTLSDRMQRGPMPPDQAADIVAQIADALDHAHRRGVVHRDIKPSNILLDEEGRPLLADFGIAQAMTSGPRLTQTNTSVGTPEYMSPEQSEGLRVDGRSDLYSLGIALYQMLTGRVPFQGNTPVATLYQVVHQPPPPIRMIAPGVPEYLESIVMRALAKNPDARFQTGKEMAQALRQRRIVAPSPVDPAHAETRLIGAPAPLQAPAAQHAPPQGYTAPPSYTPYPPQGGRGQPYVQPAPPVPQPAPAPVPRKRSSTGLIIALVVVVLALGGALAFLLTRGGGTAGNGSAEAVAPQPATTEVAALVAPPTPAATPTPIVTVVERVITATPEPTETPVPPTQTPFIVVVTILPPTATPAPPATPTPTAAPAQPSATSAPKAQPTAAPVAQPAANVPPGVFLNFENFGAWKRGDQKNGTFEQSAEQASSGKFSGKLSYTFPAVNDNFVVFLRAVPIPGQPPSLALRVLGDGGDHFLNVWVRDSQAEVRAFTFGRIPSTNEWKTVIAPLDVNAEWPAGHISGPDNGKLDFPISFQAFVLDGVPDGGGPFRGALYLDDLATSNETVGSSGASNQGGGGGAQPSAPAAPAPAPAAPAALGGHITFTSVNGGVTGVYVVDAASKNVWRVAANGRQGRIRADGRVLYNGVGGGKDNLWHVSLDGSGEVGCGAHPEDAYPDWSPSGVSATFHSSLQGDGKDRIYVQQDTGTRQEPRLLQTAGFDVFGQFPTWLGDWRIAFTGCDYWASGSNCGIYGMDSRGAGVPALITISPADRASDERGGALLFSSSRSGNWEVYSVSTAGGEPRNLTNNPSHDFGAAFSPSGGQIAFMSNRGGWSIWVMNADGSGAAQLIAVPEGFGAGWAEERLSWGP